MQICGTVMCTGCSACYSACGFGAITMCADREGFLRPIVDSSKCKSCGKCSRICPVINPKVEQSGHSQAFAAYNLNEEDRLTSSSGGIFKLLAEYILRKGGAVFGAAFDENYQVHHICVESLDLLYKLQGAKYVQSSIDDTYSHAKNILKEGRLVLFSGTPCQIEGLLSYLGKNYLNLFTQDIICHGVPSPFGWKKYLEYQQKDFGKDVEVITFRKKNPGWKRYAVSIKFSGNVEYLKYHKEDAYMKAFLMDTLLRPSCYDCKFKKIHRMADITLADFWGIEKIAPEMDDDKGTSLVIVHTEKGEYLWKAVQACAVTKSVDILDAIKNNLSMVESVKVPAQRTIFLKAIRFRRFDKCVDRYVLNKKSNLKTWFRKYARQVLGETTVKKIKEVFQK